MSEYELTPEQEREAVGRIVCCLSDVPGECSRCRKDKGCPDTWPDVAEKVDQILLITNASKQEAVRKAIEFIESYFVTTVHPDDNIHHIDSKEWQSVKDRLLRQSLGR